MIYLLSILLVISIFLLTQLEHSYSRFKKNVRLAIIQIKKVEAQKVVLYLKHDQIGNLEGTKLLEEKELEILPESEFFLVGKMTDVLGYGPFCVATYTVRKPDGRIEKMTVRDLQSLCGENWLEKIRFVLKA